MTTGGSPSGRGAPPPHGPAPTGPGPTGPGLGRSGGPEHDGSRRTQILVAVIGAIATVTAGVLAINAGAVHVSLADPTTEVDDLRATATSLERENADLQDRNEELQGQLDAADSRGSGDDSESDGGTTAVTSRPTSQASSVRRQTGEQPLTFTWGYAVDLDSPDADWRVEQGTFSGSDLYLDGSGRLNTWEVVLFDHVPTEAECRDATVRQPDLDNDQSVVGAMMCVATSEDRFAFVRIAAMDEERRTTSVDLLVWE